MTPRVAGNLFHLRRPRTLPFRERDVPTEHVSKRCDDDNARGAKHDNYLHNPWSDREPGQVKDELINTA